MVVKRLTCEFCDRKFVDETSRDRHSRGVHRKAFKLVKELRAQLNLICGTAEEQSCG